MLSCAVLCTEHLFCKLRHDLVAILLDEFLGESVHRLRGRFQLFHHNVRVGHGTAFLSLEAALHGAHIGVGVKSCLKFLCVDLAVFVQDMRIDFRDHVNLCMTGISLGSFEIPFVQFQLVGRAGVTQGMEYYIGQAGRLFKAFKLVANDAVLAGPSVVVKHFCNTLFEKSSVGSCFKWSSSVIIRMGTGMIVPYKYISA